MTVIVEAVEVRDGTYRPSSQQLQEAEENPRNERKRPQDEGYVHAIGAPRFVKRYTWKSTATGKSANGCTYPNEAAAKSAGEEHEKKSRY
jgi:hypothetical protein